MLRSLGRDPFSHIARSLPLFRRSAGYSLGPYPYFILLAVSFAFCPIFFLLVAYIDRKGDGFVEEVQSWRFRARFFIIGVLNALNGVFMYVAIACAASS